MKTIERLQEAISDVNGECDTVYYERGKCDLCKANPIITFVHSNEYSSLDICKKCLTKIVEEMPDASI